VNENADYHPTNNSGVTMTKLSDVPSLTKQPVSGDYRNVPMLGLFHLPRRYCSYHVTYLLIKFTLTVFTAYIMLFVSV